MAAALAAEHGEGSAGGVRGAEEDRLELVAERLFDAVFDQIVERALSDVPIDPAALPDYAGQLFDRYVAEPTVQRIATWHRLERGRAHPVPAVTASFESKLAALREAQAGGTLTARWSPEVLLAQILALSGMWASLSPEFEEMVTLDVAQRRQAVVDSVAALLTP